MTLRFSEDDVAAFAAASGDSNPLHLDAAYARTTPFGACVVHGALLTLAALGCLDDEVLAVVASVEVSFGGAVLVGEPAEAEVRVSPDGEAHQIRLTGRGRLLARVVARLGSGSADVEVPASGRAMRREPADDPPVAVGTELAGAYTADGLGALAARWGATALDAALAEALCFASYVVGMELPGRHGVFAALRLARVGDPVGGAYLLRLTAHDGRTGRLVLEGGIDTAAGRVATTIESFSRPPVPELDPRALLPDEPVPASGRSVVVVGGSRGFGAALALALLGRGYTVHVVHSSPAADLSALAGSHAGRLHSHQADAADPRRMEQLGAAVAASGAPLYGLVVAASPPPLPMAVTTGSVGDVVDHVALATRLAAAPLGALLPALDRDGFLVVCSSAAVTAPPRDWPHYVAAKSALEGLAAWAAVAHPGIRSVVARLPKMLTAMTNSPTMRVSAETPERVASRLVDILEHGTLAPGTTRLEDELR